MKWFYIAILAFSPLAQAGMSSHVTKVDLKPTVRAYGVAAGLPALTANSGFELRVWSRDYMLGRVGGTVIANGLLRSFNTTSKYEHEKVSIKPAPLSAPTPVSNLSKLKQLVAKLEPYSGTSVSCGVMDGGSVLLQAVVHGRMITLAVDNPSLCSDKASNTVVQILDELQSQASHGASPNTALKRTAYHRRLPQR